MSKNIFAMLAKGQPEGVSESRILTPFMNRQLTPPPRAGDKGFTHKGLGECPVCGRIGKIFQLPGPVNVTFCEDHKVSLPVPSDFTS